MEHDMPHQLGLALLKQGLQPPVLTAVENARLPNAAGGAPAASVAAGTQGVGVVRVLSGRDSTPPVHESQQQQEQQQLWPQMVHQEQQRLRALSPEEEQQMGANIDCAGSAVMKLLGQAQVNILNVSQQLLPGLQIQPQRAVRSSEFQLQERDASEEQQQQPQAAVFRSMVMPQQQQEEQGRSGQHLQQQPQRVDRVYGSSDLPEPQYQQQQQGRDGHVSNKQEEVQQQQQGKQDQQQQGEHNERLEKKWQQQQQQEELPQGQQQQQGQQQGEQDQQQQGDHEHLEQGRQQQQQQRQQQQEVPHGQQQQQGQQQEYGEQEEHGEQEEPCDNKLLEDEELQHWVQQCLALQQAREAKERRKQRLREEQEQRRRERKGSKEPSPAPGRGGKKKKKDKSGQQKGHKQEQQQEQQQEVQQQQEQQQQGGPQERHQGQHRLQQQHQEGGRHGQQEQSQVTMAEAEQGHQNGKVQEEKRQQQPEKKGLGVETAAAHSSSIGAVAWPSAAPSRNGELQQRHTLMGPAAAAAVTPRAPQLIPAAASGVYPPPHPGAVLNSPFQFAMPSGPLPLPPASFQGFLGAGPGNGNVLAIPGGFQLPGFAKTAPASVVAAAATADVLANGAIGAAAAKADAAAAAVVATDMDSAPTAGGLGRMRSEPAAAAAAAAVRTDRAGGVHFHAVGWRIEPATSGGTASSAAGVAGAASSAQAAAVGGVDIAAAAGEGRGGGAVQSAGMGAGAAAGGPAAAVAMSPTRKLLSGLRPPVAAAADSAASGGSVGGGSGGVAREVRGPATRAALEAAAAGLGVRGEQTAEAAASADRGPAPERGHRKRKQGGGWVERGANEGMSKPSGGSLLPPLQGEHEQKQPWWQQEGQQQQQQENRQRQQQQQERKQYRQQQEVRADSLGSQDSRGRLERQQEWERSGRGYTSGGSSKVRMGESEQQQHQQQQHRHVSSRPLSPGLKHGTDRQQQRQKQQQRATGRGHSALSPQGQKQAWEQEQRHKGRARSPPRMQEGIDERREREWEGGYVSSRSRDLWEDEVQHSLATGKQQPWEQQQQECKQDKQKQQQASVQGRGIAGKEWRHDQYYNQQEEKDRCNRPVLPFKLRQQQAMHGSELVNGGSAGGQKQQQQGLGNWTVGGRDGMVSAAAVGAGAYAPAARGTNGASSVTHAGDAPHGSGASAPLVHQNQDERSLAGQRGDSRHGKVQDFSWKQQQAEWQHQQKEWQHQLQPHQQQEWQQQQQEWQTAQRFGAMAAIAGHSRPTGAVYNGPAPRVQGVNGHQGPMQRHQAHPHLQHYHPTRRLVGRGGKGLLHSEGDGRGLAEGGVWEPKEQDVTDDDLGAMVQLLHDATANEDAGVQA